MTGWLNDKTSYPRRERIAPSRFSTEGSSSKIIARRLLIFLPPQHDAIPRSSRMHNPILEYIIKDKIKANQAKCSAIKTRMTQGPDEENLQHLQEPLQVCAPCAGISTRHIL